ncbi:hypothetical protein AOQ84DRAFT_217913 [Glonium stellatum]|uniref:Leucine-rich repeat domain-containing protein n=1 Tax=Glonium stellatum TaxID=574774 RepID=A0A8E2F4P9_9PEZI|nr:hypothetical protein AOQ84DRAFT_217913 [Glonium stellatum]
MLPIILDHGVASDVKNVIVGTDPPFRYNQGREVRLRFPADDLTSKFLRSLDPMDPEIVAELTQSVCVSEEYFDTALRDNEESAWVTLVLSQLTQMRTLHLRISVQWPDMPLLSLFSIHGGASSFPALREVTITQTVGSCPAIPGTETMSIFWELPSLRTFNYMGPLGSRSILRPGWLPTQSLIENITLSDQTDLDTVKVAMESILPSFKALRSFDLLLTPEHQVLQTGDMVTRFSLREDIFSSMGMALQSQQHSLERLSVCCDEDERICDLETFLKPIGSLRGFLNLHEISINTYVLVGYNISESPELSDTLPISLQSLQITHCTDGVQEQLAELAKICPYKFPNLKRVIILEYYGDDGLREAFLKVGVEFTGLRLKVMGCITPALNQ